MFKMIVFIVFLHLTLITSFQDDGRYGLNDPDFLLPMENITVPIGKEATLSCMVNNLGRYKVAWVRSEDQTVLSLQTKVVTHNARVSISHDNMQTWQLKIKHVKESDRGCYMCQINTNNIKIQQGCLDVYVSPDIVDQDTSGDLSIAEGDNATLWCKATGHPLPKVTWRREDGQPILLRQPNRESRRVDTFSGNTLNFWRLDRKQMGAYLCIASNEVPPAVSKRISLSVNFAPTIRVPNQLLGTPLNTDVQLECYVEAYPNTINYWIRNRGEMLLNGNKYEIREEKQDYRVFMWLLIKFFSEEDIGTYNCISTNSLGKAEGTLRLYEIRVEDEAHDNRVSIVGGLTESTRGQKPYRSSSSVNSPQSRLFCWFLFNFLYFIR
nr:lachesin-like isoform X1 [Onthophagus taurus]